ncbi:MAG: hypothetical protein KTV45_00310 [Acidimicrobiia bacterium]|nr:hypothetical protein [Acidimicrobiia bacterium]
MLRVRRLAVLGALALTAALSACGESPTPTSVAAGLSPADTSDEQHTPTYKTVTAGGSHSCALGTDDTITCWGGIRRYPPQS